MPMQVLLMWSNDLLNQIEKVQNIIFFSAINYSKIKEFFKQFGKKSCMEKGR